MFQDVVAVDLPPSAAPGHEVGCLRRDQDNLLGAVGGAIAVIAAAVSVVGDVVKADLAGEVQVWIGILRKKCLVCNLSWFNTTAEYC